ncbi:hypothetical protein [Halocynthiibacter styelae]|uniref:Uncharacterized protein n=1 Tax=Halocynthiibacter styelae TaxID=2761955 RepID=A0A8J7IE96_9RHOB|nr:hypothetical protein [Paenihalocynthiibacter styelae]MBI1494489.1 hypothetical protein [Paenihalocynthiibacter styelae]
MDWSALFPTLVGGGISLATTVVMFGVAQKIEKNKRTEELKRVQALAAYTGFNKLLKTANFTLSLKRHIDGELQRAKIAGLSTDYRALRVRQMVGASPMIEDVQTTELIFLTGREGVSLLNEIWEIQERARGNHAAMEKFNELRSQHDEFLHSRIEKVELVDSSVAGFSLEGDDAKLAHMKIAAMDSVLDSLIAHLEEDSETIKSVAERFSELARAEFGNYFPSISPEWKD